MSEYNTISLFSVFNILPFFSLVAEDMKKEVHEQKKTMEDKNHTKKVRFVCLLHLVNSESFVAFLLALVAWLGLLIVDIEGMTCR